MSTSTYPLKLPTSIRKAAERLARKDGVSLNQWIALAVAVKHLAGADSRRLSCPSVTELAQKTGEYQALAQAAREQGDPIHFLAALLAGAK